MKDDIEIGKKLFEDFERLGLNLGKKPKEEAVEKVLMAYFRLGDSDKYDYDVKSILDKLPASFFIKYSEVIIDAIGQTPLIWLVIAKSDFPFFNDFNFQTVCDTIKQYAPDSVAGYLIQIMDALNSEELASQIYWSQQIDHYLGLYYLSDAYYKMGNYANAIKTVHSFISSFDKDEKENPDFDFRKYPSIKFILLQQSIFLTYLYVMEKEYKKAAHEFKESLKVYNLQYLFNVFGIPAGDSNESGFDMHVINYSIALDQLNKVKPALEIIEKALHLAPQNIFLKRRKKYLKQRVLKMAEKETPAPYLKTKRAFDIDTFRDSQLISRETTLEDMIIQQIKYGNKVFGRKLELYNSKTIRGRQYIIKNQSGILDLLLIEKSTNVLYVVELKRNKAGKEVYDQVKRYMDGLKLEVKLPLRGIICLHQPDSVLTKLVKNDSEVELFTYHFEFKQLGCPKNI